MERVVDVEGNETEGIGSEAGIRLPDRETIHRAGLHGSGRQGISAGRVVMRPEAFFKHLVPFLGFQSMVENTHVYWGVLVQGIPIGFRDFLDYILL